MARLGNSWANEAKGKVRRRARHATRTGVGIKRQAKRTGTYMVLKLYVVG